jgi:hypothetical protein
MEDNVRKSLILAVVGMAFLVGCKDQGAKAPGVAAAPKWKGAPYRLAFDPQAAKPGALLPTVKFTANPEMLEKRGTLVVRFDSSQVKKQPVMDQIIMPPTELSGAEGALSADYVASANKELSNLLGAYCMKGKVKVTVALTRSSLNGHAGDAEIKEKLLSDWAPIEVVFKKAHPGC